MLSLNREDIKNVIARFIYVHITGVHSVVGCIAALHKIEEGHCICLVNELERARIHERFSVDIKSSVRICLVVCSIV